MTPFPRQTGIPAHMSLTPEEDARYRWDLRPYILAVDGHPREFFTIGHLAGGLMRSAMTIRTWESQGLFPKPTYTVNGKDPRARRRLYTRLQVEGVIRIAEEEGILDSRRRYLTQTRFPERCHELFRTCRELPDPIPSLSEDSA